MESIQYSIYVNGNIVPSSLDHDAIQQSGGQNNASVLVFFDVGRLPPGQYEIGTVLAFSKQIFDGTVYYGPGTENSTIQGTCTVIVE